MSGSQFERVLEQVNMADVISMYSARTDRPVGRIPCPIHNGKDRNFSYNEKLFNCFVCGAKGNTISFVAQLFGISNYEALKKIDSDFSLGVVGSTSTANEKKQRIKRAIAIRQEQEEYTKKHNEFLYTTEYLHALEKAFNKMKPLSDAGEWNKEYVWAAHMVSELKYKADCLSKEVMK